MQTKQFGDLSLHSVGAATACSRLQKCAAAWLVAVVSSFVAPAAQAQCPSYDVTTSTGTIIPGATDIGNHCDNCLTPVNFPFAISYFGASYSSGMVSSNGNLQFGSPAGANPAAFSNECLPSSTQITGPCMFPHWDDMISANPGFGTFWAVTGTAPNRTYVLEWRTQYRSGPGSADFEIVFHEGQIGFDFIYGTVSGGGSSATVGIQAASAGPFAQYECNMGGIGSGLLLHFEPQDCPPIPCPGADVNGDGLVDGGDLGPLIEAYLGMDTDPVHVCAADLNANGQFDTEDLDIMVTNLVFAGAAPVTGWCNGINMSCHTGDKPPARGSQRVVFPSNIPGVGPRRLYVRAKTIQGQNSDCTVRVEIRSPTNPGSFGVLSGNTSSLILVPADGSADVHCPNASSGNCLFSFTSNG